MMIFSNKILFSKTKSQCSQQVKNFSYHKNNNNIDYIKLYSIYNTTNTTNTTIKCSKCM